MVGLTNWITYAALLIGVIIGLEFGLRWGRALLLREIVDGVKKQLERKK